MTYKGPTWGGTQLDPTYKQGHAMSDDEKSLVNSEADIEVERLLSKYGRRPQFGMMVAMKLLQECQRRMPAEPAAPATGVFDE